MADSSQNIILLGINLLLFILAVFGFFNKSVAIVLGVMALVVLLNLYKISPEIRGLREEALRNKRLILVQRNKLREQKEILERKVKLEGEERSKVMKEIEKISSPKPEAATGALRMEYWDRLAKDFSKEIVLTSNDEKLMELKNKKAEIESMIEMSKKKYHKRVIDEQSFREIAKDYQKKLIEIESEIDKLEGTEEKEEENA